MTHAIAGTADLFEPRSIAVVGASPGSASFGGRPLQNLITHGFEGAVYPVNPKYSEVSGIRCYPTVDAIEADVDAAILAIPAHLVPAALNGCASKRVKLAVVISSGFAELGGDGAASQRDMVDAARSAGIRLLGPNCLGFVNVTDHIPAVATAAVQLPNLWPGTISMVSHSGALGIVSVFVRAMDHGVGYRFAVSSGNEGDLHAVELMRAFVDDSKTRVIAGLIEELRRPHELADVAERALNAGKPIVALKIGRSEGGSRAASAHTAALAGADEVYDAAFKANGIIRVDDLDELWQVPNLFASVPLPAGRRIGVISTSGGLNGLLADLLHLQGLDVPRLSSGTIDELRRALPPYAAPDNPLDLTGGIAGSDREVQIYASALELMDRDPQIDAIVLAQLAVRPEHGEVLAPLLDVIRSLRKPVILLSTGGSIAEPGMRPAHRSGVPLFTSPLACARSLGHLCDYADRARQLTARPAPARPRLPSAAPVEPLPLGLVDQEATWRLLRDAGLPVVQRRVCTSPAAALDAAAEIGYPVALKAVASGLVHKSDGGGVVLDVGDDAQLEAACRRIVDRFPGAGFEVQEMVRGGVEMIVGIQHDPHFGPVVVAGSGGVLVELVGDKQLRVAPVDTAAALEMVSSLRAARLLRGIRGGEAADVEALAELIADVSELAMRLGDGIESLDLNPVIVLRPGEGVRIVDAALFGREAATPEAAAR